MRPSFTVYLLLLSLLILSEQAHGIRLDKGSMLGGQHKSIHYMEEIALSKTNNGFTEVANKDGQFSGNNRKLINVTPSTTTTTNSKNKKNGKIKSQNHGGGDDHDHEEKSNNHVNSLVTQNSDAKHEFYPDAVDLAEMDYSPARRKTPIHN